jgi:TPR repeat protein
MATREVIAIFGAARSGNAWAQVDLGKRYLIGGCGLPKNPATAFYWLDRAASQDMPDAWMLIGQHIPFETALRPTDSSKSHVWYERAFDAGVIQAGLVLARMVLARSDGPWDEALRRKAWRGLEMAAEAGVAEAQWLLAQQIAIMGPDASSGLGQQYSIVTHQAYRRSHLKWVRRAAENGVSQAQRLLADVAWAASDFATFLRWSLPAARAIDKQSSGLNCVARRLPDEDIRVLSRCAQALFLAADFDANEVERFLELAACAGDKNAQFYLGLWYAKMDANGKRLVGIPRLINRRKAIHWLTLAGQQGRVNAWYAISRIYLKPEFSRRSLADAERYLEFAAVAGHSPAQLELGERAWRARARIESNDVRAVYWLQKAASQDCLKALDLLKIIAACATPARWAQAAQRRLFTSAYPFLAARIELAALFGLSEREALLLDLNAADFGHCLVVDIRSEYARSKRRLILVGPGEERQALSRIVLFFENVDCTQNGPEGNYRQRLYRLKAVLSPGRNSDAGTKRMANHHFLVAS